MESQILSLNQLLKKYKSDVEKLEKELEEKKEHIKIAYGALELLRQEGLSQTTQVDSSEVIKESFSEKYKGMSANKSLLDILSHSEKYLDGNEILGELMKNGFSSSSSDIKRDVYIYLYRLEKSGKIISKKIENRKKYMIRQEC